MKKIFCMLLTLLLTSSVVSFAAEKDTKISNRLFTINMPSNTKGTYIVKKKNNGISIYDKAASKSGFGGFAFGIRAYRNPADHAVLPGSTKLGELVDKKGNIYDIVLKHPTDVQYDYTKSVTAPKEYKLLYDIGEQIEIKGNKGAKYYKGQGTKGKDLYQDILKKHIKAINEKWDSTKLESENLSYMYNVLAQSTPDVLNKIGYAYYDANADGIEELFIGEIADGEWKGIIYDMYTMVNRKPQHIASGGSRNRYFVCDDTFICNEYSSGTNESGLRVYALVENSTELFPQVGFKYDGYTNPNKPWYLSYNFLNEEWENVSENEYNQRKKVFERYCRFNYIPLKSILSDS